VQRCRFAQVYLLSCGIWRQIDTQNSKKRMPTPLELLNWDQPWCWSRTGLTKDERTTESPRQEKLPRTPPTIFPRYRKDAYSSILFKSGMKATLQQRWERNSTTRAQLFFWYAAPGFNVGSLNSSACEVFVCFAQFDF
jgi:hypothetical protein